MVMYFANIHYTTFQDTALTTLVWLLQPFARRHALTVDRKFGVAFRCTTLTPSCMDIPLVRT